MKTSDLNRSAKEVHEALVGPAIMLTNIFKEKLKGAYRICQTTGWKDMEDLHRVYLINEFPGACHIRSKDWNRHITVSIKYNWDKWDKTMLHENPPQDILEFNVYDETRYPKNLFSKIKFKRLDDPNFINDVKEWLLGNKISWEKWEE
jgi:hypothetical protein